MDGSFYSSAQILSLIHIYLPYGVVKEWRDGFYIALNYTSDVQEIAILDKAEILIGSARLEAAGVVVWKEKSDNRHK